MPGENPPVGIILCTTAGQGLVHYTLDTLPTKVMAREYRLALPDEKKLLQTIQEARQQVERARLARQSQRGSGVRPGASTKQLGRLLEQLGEAEARGQLIAPPGASAYDALREAQSLAPDDRRVVAAAKRLLLAHAFEQLECIAVEFRTHRLNTQSRRAIERLGAQLDGILRAHQRASDGSLRDTAVYSITAAEWPAVRSHLDWQLARPHD
jgi:hypothetical protein